MKPDSGSQRILIVSCFCLAILTGAALLFQIEPIAGKIITPRFGGTAAVWCLVVVFFQLILLGGYLLTFFISKLAPRMQGITYICLLLLSAVFLKLPQPDLWLPDDPNAPVLSLVKLLMTYLALPCLLLSTVSGIFQSWYRLCKLGDPFILYSVSNIGSFGALISYPTLVEPHLTVSDSLVYWRCAYYALVALGCVAATILMTRNVTVPSEATTEDADDEKKPDTGDFMWWLGLSATGSILLLVFTTYLAQDIAPVPLLWVAPLCIYLLTFIICFAGDKTYYRRLMIGLSLLFLLVWPLLTSRVVQLPGIGASIAFYLSMLFCLCSVCHGELFARRSSPKYLPTFYLAIAAGGALGGILITIVSPLVWSTYHERIFTEAVMAALCWYVVMEENLIPFSNQRLFLVGTGITLSILSLYFDGQISYLLLHDEKVQFSGRNFYGSIRVVKLDDALKLFHGTTCHGYQYLDPARKNEPTGYYGCLFDLVNTAERAVHPQPLHVGAVGLGVGTVAAYGRTGDSFTFFEIDPMVSAVAQKTFSFLSGSKATTKIILGDGRTSFEKLPASEKFDILFVDVFSGDAVPIHFLTAEAFQLYLNHLSDSGVLVYHVSNRYVDLPPVVGRIADKFKMPALLMESAGTRYVVISRDAKLLDTIRSLQKEPKYAKDGITLKAIEPLGDQSVWSDNYSNIFSVLRH